MTKDVRVRFAPSPTGPLHIGGLRTALFNYLFAKKHNGKFILRIEDTDQSRYVEGAEDYITQALDWCNIPYDEGPNKDGGFGPYRQSERKNIYKKYADILISKGYAYYAFDTPEELSKVRTSYESQGKTFIYNWHNRETLNNSLNITDKDIEDKLKSGVPYVIRFKPPQNKTLKLHDLIRGDIEIDTNILDDKILFKSDGMPTYHLANIVDDHLMEISHVIRGEEWLPSLALHVLLYQALDWDTPEFAHLPLILKPTGKGKLGKRDGIKGGFPVFPLAWEDPKTKEKVTGYKEDGYSPEALINMLALLGWNPGTEQEIFNLNELIYSFDIKKINKSGAKFDPDKTKWFQQQHFQNIPDGILLENYKEVLSSKDIDTTLDISKIANSIKERATFYNDLWELSEYFYNSPKTFDQKALKKAWKEDTHSIMEELKLLIQSIHNYSNINLSDEIKGWIKAKELPFGKVMMPLRLSLVGSLQGPDVFMISQILGKSETISRIDKFLTHDKQLN